MMNRRIISLFLVVATLLLLCIPAFAAEPNETLPPWVEEGETWHPVGDIALHEDEGRCPKGHGGPAGYTYQGYTTGKTGMDASGAADFRGVITIISILADNDIVVKVASLGNVFLEWLERQTNKNQLPYFKYVYTKPGYAPYVHIVYTFYEDYYHYVTCETYSDIG